MKSRDEGVKGLSKVKTDLSHLEKMRGRVWVRAERGFSLIELIGVLAVMGILASMTVPPILRQVRQAQSGNEEANLNEVARAIVEGIKATGTIPNPNILPADPGGWVNVAYNYTTLTDDIAPGGGFAPGTLHYVFPAEADFSDVFGTSRTYADTARRVYLDPVFLAYLESLPGGISGIFNTLADGWPETTAGGVNFPNQAIKLFVASSSRPDFVLSCPTNGLGIQVSADNYRTTLVNELGSWIKVIDPATGFIKAPGAAIENWPNNGHQFLHVKTVDLRPLFCRVQLEDGRSPATALTNISGSGYTNYGPLLIATNGVTISISFSGATNTNTSISSASVISSASTILWSSTGMTNSSSTPFTNAVAVSPGGGSVNLVFPATPSFSISTYGLATMTNQNISFFLLKGAALQLGDASLGLQRTVIINQDISFHFSNGSWTQSN